jgi:hypothetical protein
METPVDKRLIKAIIAEVANRKRYTVPFTAVLKRPRLLGMSKTKHATNLKDGLKNMQG